MSVLLIGLFGFATVLGITGVLWFIWLELTSNDDID